MIGEAFLIGLFLDGGRDLLLEARIDVNNIPTLGHLGASILNAR
jgi:hypothetical protein